MMIVMNTSITSTFNIKMNTIYDSFSAIGEQAQKFVHSYYDHGANAHRLLEKYQSLKNNPQYHKSTQK